MMFRNKEAVNYIYKKNNLNYKVIIFVVSIFLFARSLLNNNYILLCVWFQNDLNHQFRDRPNKRIIIM